MEKKFEAIIASFLQTNVGIQEDFLELNLSKALQAHLLSLLLDEQLQEAGIGNKAKFSQNELVRGDKIYWLDRQHKQMVENYFLDVIDQFVQHLNRTCYTGITGYEFHYALYEKDSFYKRHLDQFQDNKTRAYSMIVYLNSDWVPADGGELCIYHPHHAQHIAPSNQKCVFFKSDQLEHEVLPTHKNRLSITGWLKVD